MADIQDYKYMDDAGFRKYTSILVGLMSKASTLESRCVMPYDGTKQYSSTELVIKDGAIYEAKTATTGTWDPTKWTVMDGTEIDASKVIDAAKIDALMTSVSQDTWDYLEQIISDDAVSTKKTYSSSKVVNELVNQESVLKAYVLTEIAKHSTGSYEIASSTADMTDTAVFYLLKNGSNYDIYALLSGTPTKLTSLNIDLTAYLKTEDAESTYLKKTDASATYATIAALDDKLDADDYKLTDLIDDTTSGTDKVYSSDKTEKRILQHLNSGNTEIKENDDLNTYLTAGVYTCLKSATAKTLLNCPHTKSNFKLIVDKNTGNDTSFWGTQIIKGTLNSPCTDVCVYYRGVTYETSTTSYSFTEWKQMATLEKVNNQNLLDNPFFTVNQRGQSTLTVGTTMGHFVDRWRGARATYSLSDDGLSIVWDGTNGTNGYIGQYIENGSYYVGKTATISAIIDGELFTYTGTVPAKGGTSFGSGYTLFGNTVRIIVEWTSSQTYLHVGIANNSTTPHTVKAVKLELGSVSTLANDVPPNYATELLKCQRYFYRINVVNTNDYIGHLFYCNTTDARLVFPMPIELLKVPTVSYSSLSDFKISDGYATYGTPSVPTKITCVSGTKSQITVKFETDTQTIGKVRSLYGATPGAYIDFSADL